MTPVANQYGQALYELVLAEGLVESVHQQLKALRESFRENPEYIRLLSAPSLGKSERCALLEEGFGGKLQPYLLNFLKILTEKGYMRHFDGCCQVYTDLYNRDNGILPVTAVTAAALANAQADRLRQKLANMTGKTIELHNRIDPACLGGIRLEYDGKSVDDTVAHRLDSIRQLLKETVI